MRERGRRKTKPPRRRLLPPSGRGDGLRWSASILHLRLHLFLVLLHLLLRSSVVVVVPLLSPFLPLYLLHLLGVYRIALANLKLRGLMRPPGMVRAAIVATAVKSRNNANLGHFVSTGTSALRCAVADSAANLECSPGFSSTIVDF